MTSNGSKTPTARLLIVDDDATNLLLLRRLLEQTYPCLCVQSGQEALDALERDHYDLVLLDIMMPHMNGLQVLETLRKSPAYAMLPVILISALSESADVAHGLELGANDYITKPIDVAIVSARINTQLTLKRLVDERNETIEQLRAAQEMRERFFRIATHDLKNPLANMRLANHLMRAYLGEHAGAREVLNTMTASVETMQEVISEFLDAALLQSGKIDLKRECVSAEKLLWDVVVQYEPIATSKQIALQVTRSDGSAIIDFARMAQAVANLVSNAIKYSPTQTTISLSAERRRDRVLIAVKDQGPGIPAHEQKHLFEEFGKSSNRPTGGESSTGLGLWIVKHLVLLHGGEVGVECPPEGGSVFYIHIPAC
jgi:two-component system, sensor histidine kinase and response regulator